MGQEKFNNEVFKGGMLLCIFKWNFSSIDNCLLPVSFHYFFLQINHQSAQVEIIELGINKTRTNCVFVGMRNNKSVIRKKEKRSTVPSIRNSKEAFCYGRK